MEIYRKKPVLTLSLLITLTIAGNTKWQPRKVWSIE